MVWGVDLFVEEVFGVSDIFGGVGGSIVNGEVFVVVGIYYTCGVVDEFTWYNVIEFEFLTVNQEVAIVYMVEFALNVNFCMVDGSIML